VIDSINLSIEEKNRNLNRKIAEDYTVTNTSFRVLKLIIGNAKLSNKWWGVER